MSQKSCCVPGCSITAGCGIPLHCFPNPRNSVLFKTWINTIGGNILDMDEDAIFRNRRVCRRHFERVYLYPTKLCPLAVPSLHLPGCTESMELGITVDMPQQAASSASVALQSGPEAMELTVIEAQNIVASSSTVAAQIPVHKPRTKREKQLHKIISEIKLKLKKTQKQRDNHKQRAFMARKLKKSEAFNLLIGNMTEAAKTFFAMQITQFKKKARGRRFNMNEKILCLSLYKRSPKAYRMLGNLCILPKRKTLQNLLQKIDLKPGINKSIFTHLKNKVSGMPEHHKFCSLIFDEMAISPSLVYNKKKDCIIGLVDDGEEKKKEISDHVLVFMVRGVIKKFKQPIAYSYCLGSTKTNDLIKQIKSIIKETEKTGLKVIATICDQGSSNRAAINSLLNETRSRYVREGREWRGGFFETENRKVFPIFDPPHLIKGIRNNLLSKDLHFMDGKAKVASWSHIESLYRRGPGYKGVRLVPKLTAQHVIPNMIPKMRVKHCTQVFSRTVGVALGFMADCGILARDAQDTADILILFDNIFDSVNGSHSIIKNGKAYRAAVTPKSPHHLLWRKSLPILKSMRFVDKKGKKALVPSLSSWVSTIEGFELITEYFKSQGITSLLLRNFNQDPLENFFGAIRAHGQSNIMPNVQAFEGAFKTLIINNMSSTHSVGANCEKDDSSCLQSLKHLLTIEDESSSDASKQQIIDEKHLNIPFVDIDVLIKGKSPTDVERCAAIAYCSGWLATRVQKNVYKKCDTCRANLTSEEIKDFHAHIKMSEYENKSWLCYPTRELFNCFAQIENIVLEILKDDCRIVDLNNYIALIVITIIDFSFISCGSHKKKVLDFLINYSIVFFIRNWTKEISGTLSGKYQLYDEGDELKTKAYTYYVKNKTRKCRK